MMVERDSSSSPTVFVSYYEHYTNCTGKPERNTVTFQGVHRGISYRFSYHEF